MIDLRGENVRCNLRDNQTLRNRVKTKSSKAECIELISKNAAPKLEAAFYIFSFANGFELGAFYI